MSVSTRRGFTLAELLVVITIIGMLVGLLVPAVMGAREQARRTQCGNNQAQLAKALAAYDLAKQHYPGYAETVGGNYQYNINWLIALFPNLGRNDLWAEWDSAWQGRNRPARTGAVEINFFKCPNDPAPDAYAISYVANCGLLDSGTTPPDWPETGVFHNHATLGESGGCARILPTYHKYVSAGEMKDGAQYTILLTENIQATNWCVVQNTGRLQATTLEYRIGVLWYPPPMREGVTHLKMNELKDATSPGAYHARPSANHGNIVVATFCDGHQQRLRTTIEYPIYAQLLSPNSREAKRGWNGAPVIPANMTEWYRPLSDSDFE